MECSLNLLQKRQNKQKLNILPLTLGLKSKYMELRLNSGCSNFFNSFQSQMTFQKVKPNLK